MLSKSSDEFLLKSMKIRAKNENFIYLYIKKKKMKKEVQKKTGVIFLLTAIILAIAMTMYILNYVQKPKVTQVELKESASSGEISLTVKKPLVLRDESIGSLSLTVLPSGS